MTPSRFSAVALLLAASIAPARAQEPAKPPQMSPEEQAAMEKYMKAAAPGPEHQKLAKLAGKWKMQLTSWFAPGAPPQKGEGTSEFKTILGGRYLQQEVKSEMAGMPFEGFGVEGYDNVLKQQFATWVDSMSTGVLEMRGKCEVTAKKCTTKGKGSDAVSGKELTFSATTIYTDDDHLTFQLYGPAKDGKQFKMLEIVYTRQ